MSGSLAHGSNAEPNLTPILDMVFQLITFFMLVINFQSAAMDTSLKLPVIGSARPVEKSGQDLLVLNIDTEGRLKFYGQVVEDVEGRIKYEAAASKMVAISKTGKPPGDDEGLPSTVVIRADMYAPFSKVYDIIKICQDNNYQKFAFKAMNKKEQ